MGRTVGSLNPDRWRARNSESDPHFPLGPSGGPPILEEIFPTVKYTRAEEERDPGTHPPPSPTWGPPFKVRGEPASLSGLWTLLASHEAALPRTFLES